MINAITNGRDPFDFVHSNPVRVNDDNVIGITRAKHDSPQTPTSQRHRQFFKQSANDLPESDMIGNLNPHRAVEVSVVYHKEIQLVQRRIGISHSIAV